MNVILIGYRAAGKTSVGRSLAGLLNRPFHDTDEMVVEHTGKTIPELVAEGGWPLFREKEKNVVAGLSRLDHCVITLGGGTVLNEENVERLREKGLFVWLRADAAAIVKRMSEDRKRGHQRPSLSGNGTDEEVPAMLRCREDVYRRNADLIVNTENRSIEEVSEEICTVLIRHAGLAPASIC